MGKKKKTKAFDRNDHMSTFILISKIGQGYNIGHNTN